MPTRARLLIGSVGILALLGCYSSDNHYSPASSYLVNAIAVADIDANGLPDILGLVSTAYGDNATQGYVSTRLQTTAGAFAMPVRFGVGTGPSNFVLADINGDGLKDLVVANADDQTVSVRYADPAKPGYFQPAIVLPLPGFTPLDVAVGNLSGHTDGRLDIVVAAAAAPGVSSVQIFYSTGIPGVFNGGFYAVNGFPTAVTVADLDGNGFDDIAVALTSNAVSVLLQTSPHVFAPAVTYPTGVQPVAIKAADLKGDGHLALLTANYGASTNPDTLGLSVLLQGTTPGTFLAPVHYATGYRSTALAVGDLNGDGKPDVVVTNSGLSGDPGSVSVLFQAPATTGALLPAVNYTGVYGPMGVAIADMDGDGHPDLVLADGDIVVRFNSPTTPGTFGPPNFFYN
jgi:hypothetical protein